MLSFTSNEELQAQEQAEYDERERLESGALSDQEYVIGIVAYIKQCWEAAKRAKQPHEEIMLDNLRRKVGEYGPDKLAAIREQGGSEAFMMLTEEKLSAFESWVDEILFPADSKPWGIRHTPKPELSPEIIGQIKQQLFNEVLQQYRQAGVIPTPQDFLARANEIMEDVESEVEKTAKKNADKTEKYLEDIVVESKWRQALRDAISDVGLYPAGFLKGPLRRIRNELQWGEGGNPVVGPIEKWEWESPSPWDIYPSPSSKDIGDGYLIEKMNFTRQDLQSLIGVEGYNQEEIEEVLSAATNGSSSLNNWLGLYNQTERNELEGRENEWEDPEGKIDGLQFWGYIQGLKLIEYGYPGDAIKPFDEYFCETILIHNWVIKCEINGDPLGRPPYFKASFREKKGSFWGMGLPETMPDSQDACNATVRALLNNLAVGSGPQVGVDIGKFATGEKVTKLRPWKIWQFDLESQPQQRDPMWFFQPKSLANELLGVYEKFSQEADNKTGVPRYSYGAQTTGGAINTASGMSMMMANAARSIKKVIGNIDGGMIEPSIDRVYQWAMIYKPIQSMLAGDIKVVARGSSALISKEMRQVRRNEAVQTVLNPMVHGIIGNHGIAVILREWFKGLDFDADDIIPSEAEMTQIEALQMQIQQLLQYIQGGGGQPGQGQIAGPGNAEQPRETAPDGSVSGDARMAG